MSHPETHLVNASLDFGTHATGYGWCEHGVDDPALRKIRTFDQWPNQPVPSVKTLTALLLDRDGDVIAWGHDALRRWNEHRADRRDKGWRYHHGFKMHLAKDAPRLRTSWAAYDESEEPVENLITKFLRCMLRHVLADLAASGYQESDIRWCITVPAIWNDHQKVVMRKCAERAGFPTEDGRLILAYEPEAAAQHARVSNIMITDSLGGARDVLTAPGRRVVVADCGGGTADMTSFQVEPDGSLVEVGRVSGDARGSHYVNEALLKNVLVPRLGGEKLYKKLVEQCPEGVEDLLAAWERAKLNVVVDQARPVYLPIPFGLAKKMPPRVKRALAEAQDGNDTNIVVTVEEIKAAFETVVHRICELVSEQVDMVEADAGEGGGPVVVLLVGGFAASEYLRRRLIDHIKDLAIVVVPPDPQVAVLSGAVHFACRPDIRARRARRTYGIAMRCDFEEGIDDEARRCPPEPGEDHADKCVDRFVALVEKGTLVPTDAEVWQDGYPIKGDQTEVAVEFYGADDGLPRNVDDPNCKYLGKVLIKLGKAMRLSMKGRAIRVLMKFGETEIKVRVVVLATGVELPYTLELAAS
ncbi:hypothetical protein N8J89_03670 [Crossiella sp. CA-258035]|uniref:Hsp70 family protein n=1 Tax=Crossiella sp. CA-258035 TaxID=2981138 RepID=UPI0024BD147E|nr:hypothetical protein [Crossiella sp. CA-258035]WHT20183.1 hypothetical protein N8J89_03670 [Crossiella sp. CA-258035]